LNFACPVRKALSRRRGGFLMSRPKQALEIVRAVVGAVDRCVTLKMRRSFKEKDKTHDAFWEIAEGAFDAGVAAICVHGRSVEAKYTGPADWEFIAQVKRRFHDRTIVASGDVLEPPDALRMLAATGADAVAVARGVLGNPWFFRQVQDVAAGQPPYSPSIEEQKALLQRHFTHACTLYGPVRGPKIMRKFGIKYARLHPRPKEVRAAFLKVMRPEHWKTVLERFYSMR
jgi:tRNA-dihydrouridine synthase B